MAFIRKFSAEAVFDEIERSRVSTLLITGDAMARPLIECLEANPGRWDLSSFFVLSSSAVTFSPPSRPACSSCCPTS
ncbi:MAG: hypothetical protein R2711_04475 [Acidimicrobiales bacterium]